MMWIKTIKQCLDMECVPDVHDVYTIAGQRLAWSPPGINPSPPGAHSVFDMMNDAV